jgi:hypothetical protein
MVEPGFIETDMTALVAEDVTLRAKEATALLRIGQVHSPAC